MRCNNCGYDMNDYSICDKCGTQFSLIEYYKNLIANNKSVKAINELSDLLKTNDSDLFNEVILQSSRLNSIFNQFHLGIIELSDFQITKSKIEYAIIDLIDRIPSKILKNDKISVKSEMININSIALTVTENNPNSYIGKQVGNYKIIDYIGFGGFGTVFKAEHKMLKNTVALKISHKITVGKNLLIEIITTGILGLKQLDHPNIVKIHDIGELELNKDSRIYVVMDFVEGEHLGLAKNENLNRNEILNRIEIFKKICIGLAYAHTNKYKNIYGFEITGILHGDIKPENILLTKNDEPKIIDFMFVDLNTLHKIIITKPNFSNDRITAAFGTEGYMSKEQSVDGFVTVKTDIFSLGILLFEILCPLKFANVKYNSSNQIYSLLSNYNKNIPKYVSDIIFKATQERPENRYNSINEIINEINKNKSLWQKIFLK